MASLNQKIALVVFDMAGTTVRDLHEVEKCFLEAAQASGLAVTSERVLAMQGLPKRLVIKTLWEEAIGIDHPDLADKVDHTYEQFTAILEQHYLTAEVTEVAGAADCFRWLRSQGIKVALTTGFYRKVTNIILHRLGWDTELDADYLAVGPGALIDLSLTPDETGMGRPHPDMILKAMATLGISDAATVINLGDTPSDLASAAAAGVGISIGVCEGTHSREALEAYPHDILLPSVAALPAFLVQHFSSQAS